MFYYDKYGFVATNMDGDDCPLQPGWNPFTINCFVMENPNTASFFHLSSFIFCQNFGGGNPRFKVSWEQKIVANTKGF